MEMRNMLNRQADYLDTIKQFDVANSMRRAASHVEMLEHSVAELRASMSAILESVDSGEEPLSFFVVEQAHKALSNAEAGKP